MSQQPAIQKSEHLLNEADVGSGERNAGQRDTDALIEKIAERPPQPGAVPPVTGSDVKTGEAANSQAAGPP